MEMLRVVRRRTNLMDAQGKSGWGRVTLRYPAVMTTSLEMRHSADATSSVGRSEYMPLFGKGRPATALIPSIAPALSGKETSTGIKMNACSTLCN